MKRVAVRSMFCLLAYLGFMAGFPRPASSATIFMNDITGTGARNFADPTIWPLAVPAPGDFPVMAFGDGINDYVYVEAATTVQRINVGNTLSGGLEIRPGATLTTTAAGASESNIGPTGTGHLRIKSGAVVNQAGLLYLGLNATGVGVVTLENGTHSIGLQLAVGRGGTGTYNMLGGSLTVGSYLLVGRTGTGTFTQSGGTLQVNRVSAGVHGMFLAQISGATGTYDISGGSLTVAASNAGVINGTAAPEAGAFGTFRIIGSAPTVTIESNYEQHADARFAAVIDAGGISPMNVGGNINLDGILDVSFSTTPALGQQFVIMNYSGTLTGQFASFDALVDSPQGPDSIQLSIDYGGGTNSAVVLTVVPEPYSFVLIFLMLGVSSCRIRKCISISVV